MSLRPKLPSTDGSLVNHEERIQGLEALTPSQPLEVSGGTTAYDATAVSHIEFTDSFLLTGLHPFIDLADYQAFTPVLTASGGVNPANWTCLGAYVKLNKFFHYFGYARAGVAPTMGTGTWSISAPLANNSLTDIVGGSAEFVGFTPPSKEWPFQPALIGTAMQFSYPATWPGGNATLWGSGSGWAPVQFDILRFNVVGRTT